MTTIILIRHGETEANVQQVWQGSLDAPLTQRGQQQVAATAARMAALSQQQPIDAFYVSPLPRARSTALAIAAAIQQQPIIAPELREFDLGDWEGRSFRELKEQERLWERWRVDPTFAPPNGESPHTFNLRAVNAIRTLADAHLAQTLLMVTHGGLICNVLATWLGAGPSDWHRWEPHNCAITILQVHNGEWQAQLVNDISHLPPTMIVDETPVYVDP
jgi:broad specificity phosphatase PhoE